MSVFNFNGEEIKITYEILNLSDRNISDLSAVSGLENLSNLVALILSNNNIKEIGNIEKLTNLKELYLSENEISEISNIENLNRLQAINLGGNEITKISGLDAQINLRYLYLAVNGITKIENLNHLDHLEWLDLSRNHLNSIENINQLNNLKFLDLNHNQIKHINGLETLTNLEYLNLSGNPLRDISGLEKLTKLVTLRIDSPYFKAADRYWGRFYSHPQQIVEYCRRKKRGEPENLELYDTTITPEENIKNFEKSLLKLEDIDFVNIGTHRENQEYRWKQNRVFLETTPVSKSLLKRYPPFSYPHFPTDKVGIVHLIQLHSLKGINPPELPLKEEKLGHFHFFLDHFWSIKQRKRNRILAYDNKLKHRVTRKIEELIDLSIKFNPLKPSLIIFPENSIPHSIIPSLKKITEKENLVIVGGLEHTRNKENGLFQNCAFVIDNGNIDFQLKQTPVWIFDSIKNKYEKENIICQKLAKINIFMTSIGRIAILICKDFLRFNKILSDWVWKNNVDYVVIPSLTGKVYPFHSNLFLHDYKDYKDLILFFTNIGEYGGSESFSLEDNIQIEKRLRNNNRDNFGETIVVRKFKYKIKYIFKLIIDIFENYHEFRGNDDIEKDLVKNLGLFFIEGKEVFKQYGFAYLHNDDTIRDYNYEVHLTRDRTNIVYQFLVRRLVDGKRVRNKNVYLSIHYPKSTVDSIGSDYKVLIDFIAYLKEII